MNHECPDNYHDHKEKYLSQFSSEFHNFLKTLESRESWSLENRIAEVDDLFNKLPEFCRLPIEEPYMLIINEIIPILAYMPITDMLGAFHWLGTRSEQWGYAIYKTAFEYYRNNVATSDPLLFASSKQVIDRIELTARESIVQVIIGEKYVK